MKLACMTEDEFITTSKALEILGMSKSAFYRIWKKAGFPQAYYPMGRRKVSSPHCLFKRLEIELWFVNNKRQK